MELSSRPRRTLWRDQQGFTLAEVMITVVIMGIVLAIATSTYQRVIEGRQVDSATNQLVSDMRLAHSKATNRLTAQMVTLNADSSEYSVTGAASPRDLDDNPDNDLVVVDTAVTITFNADGSATVDPGGVSSVQVQAARNSSNFHTVEFNSVTSRVTAAQ